MTDLIDTTEMYLKTIYELVEEGITPLRARIAERLGHSGPTVSQTVARMERDGLVVVTGDRHLELTEAGTSKARRVMRKHRLAERLLTDVIKLDWEQVHTEACRWEHVMSEDVERRLLTLLDHPSQDPYGNPIPGLSELVDGGPEAPFLAGVTPLPAVFHARAAVTSHTEAAPQQAGAVPMVLERIGEPLQVDVELLARFAQAQLVPGAGITVSLAAGEWSIGVDATGAELRVNDEVTRHLFVTRR